MIFFKDSNDNRKVFNKIEFQYFIDFIIINNENNF